jgi:outer membrane lipoprotein-sorting protein
VEKVDDFALAAEGLRDGTYRIEWWETWKGTLQRQEEVRVRDGKLRLEFRGLKSDTAIKAKRFTSK